ncbi:cytochrome P-450 monooxygenase CYP65A1 [Fusarium austroafricanum]|uniref:Cytochrome P-450 monooxygenase CYP65A1 n=1 Tax=Fusarium austroafricanum TaxID=2364996 RepID=A0A8H4P3I5_9HYPO|nr:cytochrome P-450 monooxygenase CYP65A1 [Fusarium austroafricanum]
MLTTDTENHTRVRRLFSPAFSERALKQQEPLFKKYTDLLVYKISEVGSEGVKSVEMTQPYNLTTFDIMAELCFGHSLNLLAENKYSPWVKSIFESLKMLPIASMINYYPLLNVIFTRFEPKSVTERALLIANTQRIVLTADWRMDLINPMFGISCCLQRTARD